MSVKKLDPQFHVDIIGCVYSILKKKGEGKARALSPRLMLALDDSSPPHLPQKRGVTGAQENSTLSFIPSLAGDTTQTPPVEGGRQECRRESNSRFHAAWMASNGRLKWEGDREAHVRQAKKEGG